VGVLIFRPKLQPKYRQNTQGAECSDTCMCVGAVWVGGGGGVNVRNLLQAALPTINRCADAGGAVGGGFNGSWAAVRLCCVCSSPLISQEAQDQSTVCSLENCPCRVCVCVCRVCVCRVGE
jgi:hypothetical protein